MTRHILVTGGTGFIGSAVIEALITSGFKVTTVSRSPIESNNHHALDLTDKELCADFARSLKSVTTIIHCAAMGHRGRPPKENSVADFNSLIVENLVSAFGDRQPHWIFLSSMSVYGECDESAPIPIKALPKTVDVYGWGKLQDEQRLLSVCENIDILRLAPVYDCNHVDNIKRRIYFPGTKIKLRILPPPSYCLCDVGLVVDAVLQCLEGKPGRRLHQIGDTEPVSQRDLLDKFQGFTVTIPVSLFRFCISLLPRKLKAGRMARLLLKKLVQPDIYQLGVVELSEKKP